VSIAPGSQRVVNPTKLTVTFPAAAEFHRPAISGRPTKLTCSVTQAHVSAQLVALPGVEPATHRCQIRRHDSYTTKPPKCNVHSLNSVRNSLFCGCSTREGGTLSVAIF